MYEDDDDELDHEAPDDFDTDDGGKSADASVDTIPCPYCGKAVYEQAELCPHCRSYLSVEDRPLRKPLWLVLAVIACLLAVLVGWLFTKPFS